MQSPPELILASTSVYRQQLLSRLGIAFSCRAPAVDESALRAEQPRALAVRLARAKAAAVAAARPEAWVIGSDQVAVLHAENGERVYGKPEDAAGCADMLLGCSGRVVSFVTAVALARGRDSAWHECVDVTRVRFRTLDRGTVERYVEREAPLDCAGGFKSEGLGIALCEAIESTDPTALVGLPLIGVTGLLRAAGFVVP